MHARFGVARVQDSTSAPNFADTAYRAVRDVVPVDS
jgi:hypothetical protein